MTKLEFLEQLRAGLSGLPQEDIEERLSFYSEMIDDRIEEGLLEEEAINEIGNVDEIVAQIIADTPLTKLVKEKIKPKRVLRAWEIILLILGSPIWLCILLAIFAVILCVYIVLWAVIVCLWAVFVSLFASALAVIVAGFGLIFTGNTPSGLIMIGATLICAGLSILMFFACKAATKGTAILTKKIALGFKKCFVRKERS